MYKIGELEFKTKKESYEYTKNIIYSIENNKIIDEDNKHYIFFNDLLKNHYIYDDIKGCGIKHFQIIPNHLVKKFKAIKLIRLDDTEIIFSWNKCCQFKENCDIINLKKTMRYAIHDKIIKFKQNNKKKCQICNIDNLEYYKYHVDHIDNFKKIYNDFLKINKNKIPTNFLNCDVSNGMLIFKKEDNNFKNEWVKYHNEKAKYQILCYKCNISKQN